MASLDAGCPSPHCVSHIHESKKQKTTVYTFILLGHSHSFCPLIHVLILDEMLIAPFARTSAYYSICQNLCIIYQSSFLITVPICGTAYLTALFVLCLPFFCSSVGLTHYHEFFLFEGHFQPMHALNLPYEASSVRLSARMEVQQGERTVFSACLYIGEQKQPTLWQRGVFKAETRDGHAVCTFQVHSPTSPCPTLSTHTDAIFRKKKKHCAK